MDPRAFDSILDPELSSLLMWREVLSADVLPSVFFAASCPLPPQLVKTAELPPDRNYVLASHPHGIIAIGSFCNFATEGTGSSQQFPGLRFSLAVLNCLLYIPGHREYFLSCGEFELVTEGDPTRIWPE